MTDEEIKLFRKKGSKNFEKLGFTTPLTENEEIRKLKVLNLYAGIGGNRKLWTNVDVTAIEIEPKIAKIYQGFFPDDKVIIADAHQFLLEHFEEFDFIWSSPPCQSHSGTNFFLHSQGVIRYPDMKLYEEIVFLKAWFKGMWVVENVKPYYEPLINAQKCGRHLFWSNFPIPFKNFDIEVGTFNRKSSAGRIGKMCGRNQKAHLKNQEERNMVSPELGLHVFNCAFKIRQKRLIEC